MREFHGLFDMLDDYLYENIIEKTRPYMNDIFKSVSKNFAKFRYVECDDFSIKYSERNIRGSKYDFRNKMYKNGNDKYLIPNYVNRSDLMEYIFLY